MTLTRQIDGGRAARGLLCLHLRRRPSRGAACRCRPGRPWPGDAGRMARRGSAPRFHGPAHPVLARVRHAFGAHLQLSEAQQDKLFAIEHAAAPQRRQQEKAIRHAHEALRAARDAPFDEGKASAASRELGQAVAAEALLEARLHAQVLAVLTPEQREQLRQRRQSHRQAAAEATPAPAAPLR
jgi:protein CpxP